MRHRLIGFCILVFGIVCQSFALSPAIPDAGVVVYAYRNLDAVGTALRVEATQAGWRCDRPEPANPLAQNNLILQCKGSTGQGFIVADDFVDPLDRATVQGYADAENLDEMLNILRGFVRRVSEIPKTRILFQKFPEGRDAAP